MASATVSVASLLLIWAFQGVLGAPLANKSQPDPSIRLLHGSGYLPTNTFEKYWSRYAEAGKRIGMILNGGGSLEQGEAAFASRARQMSTAMGVPEENFVFIPLYGNSCPDMANNPEVAQLIESCDAIYMPGGNQGMLAACIYGVVSDSGVDSPEDTLAVEALRTIPMVGGDSAGAMNQPSSPMMSRHDEDWSSCFPCDECCGESYCALTNGCVFTRNVGNRLVEEDNMMIHTHVAERGRQGFLLVSILMHLEDGITQGIGADEGAALYCSNNDKWCECLADAGRGIWVYVGVTGTIEATSAEMHFLYVPVTVLPRPWLQCTSNFLIALLVGGVASVCGTGATAIAGIQRRMK
eukprot:COSAG02_NODE_612_length_19541_cov_13.245150_13_plen_353_part_00